ncbi:AAA family ATPase [Paenarthrobacter sp. GOM3]|uniref:ATP-dependent nuclease n=1 Tax=Paenarthrobacter sp. GOM3 TaxID=2782567 RepID=UPI001BA7A0CB|nr:AAA family ATPase [Paenarthrobacter sp. GOM3]WOH20513.1 AAA family ATPase [Paenarthrobacter sp. GOM3]
MKLDCLTIQNFRALKSISIPLSTFGCIIGENNAGKSSVLHALVFALTGQTPRKLNERDFHDPSLPIRVELKLTDITTADFAQIGAANHRAAMESDVINGELTLVRIVAPGSTKQVLQLSKACPANENLLPEVLKPKMTGKKDTELYETVIGLIPELADRLDPKKLTQKQVAEACDSVVANIPRCDLVMRDCPLGTGIEAAVKDFLPEPIYIEAVKDVAGEMKTAETATFGKLLKLLLDEVEDEFDDLQAQFQDLQKRLSRVLDSNGEPAEDLRLEAVKKIEQTVEDFVRESFPGVELRLNVPVPELKTIFSTAEMSIDDGHEGPVTGKGDGLKRAVAFAILRAYTLLRAEGLGSRPGGKPSRRMNVLLFEEPELYLHPKGQRQLFRALELFSHDHPVLVTTHSPLFFSADATTTFTKLRKAPSAGGLSKVSEAFPVNVTQMNEREAFQIICHENNESAFFSNAVVLVEGESDAVVFPHLAEVINPEWSHLERNLSFVITGGKTNISKYRSFFDHFKIDVHVLCDLDALLDGFSHINTDGSIKNLRDQMIETVDAALPSEDEIAISAKDAEKLSNRGRLKSQWESAERAYQQWDGSELAMKTINDLMKAFFGTRRGGERLNVLRTDTAEVLRLKNELLKRLRDEKVYVFSRGDLEAYYGSVDRTGLGGKDKVRLAMHVKSTITNVDDFRKLHGEDADEVVDELSEIMSRVYERLVPVA